MSFQDGTAILAPVCTMQPPGDLRILAPVEFVLCCSYADSVHLVSCARLRRSVRTHATVDFPRVP